MKKTFTLIALLAMVLTVSAQGYRKWDFTSWGSQTVANLAAEAERGGVAGGVWSDTEKSDGSNPQVGKCYWSYGDNVIDGELSADGAVIAETAGLVFNTAYTVRRSLAIAVDYPSTSLGDYAGPKYLWLGGGNAKSADARIWCFAIPKVRVGQKIVFTVESHKGTDSRGVALFVGDCKVDDYKIGEDFKPTALETHTWEEGWTLPDGAPTNDDGTVDIQVYNTNGCHIYSIEVGTDDQKSKVAYLYEGSLDAEKSYPAFSQSDRFTVEPIAVTGALTMDQLTAYDAIIISSTVANAEAVSSLYQIQPFVPTLNLNPALYAAWGVGETAESGTPFAMLTNAGSALFRGMQEGSELIEDPDTPGTLVLELVASESFTGVVPAGRFLGDNVLASAYGNPELAAIHQHSPARNSYMYIPYTQDVTLNSELLLTNAAAMLVNTKAKVAQAPAPAFALEYKNQNTNVTIKSGVPAAEIFYTTDGSVPTENSTLYTGPFNLTKETTVKAVVRGEGYLMSEVAEQLVDMKNQLPAPVIAQEQADGKTILKFSVDVADSTAIYYNYSGSTSKANSSLYSEDTPVEVSIVGRIVYAFASADGYVDSELASQQVAVKNPHVRIDVLAHMDANSTDYNNGSTSTAYYFSWGKQKADYAYYNLESAKEEITQDEDGNEVVVTTYTELNPEEEKDFGNGWMLRSRGQIVDWENLNSGSNYGNKDGYNFATVDDENPYFPATKGLINLADKNTTPGGVDFPYNAYIVTTQKFKGPFDVVANIGSIVKPANSARHNIVFEVSADGYTWESGWTVLGDTIDIVEKQRLTTNVTRSYEGTDEVYVRAYLCAFNSKVGFYDIYIANAGEKSQELMSGIKETTVVRPTAAEAYFDLQGRRLQGRPAHGLYIHNGKKYIVK